MTESAQQCLFQHGTIRCAGGDGHTEDHQIPWGGRIWFYARSVTEPDLRQLPSTRADLAEFFGDIRDQQGRGITGYFVEMALQYLTMTEADSDLRNVRPDHRHAVEEAFRKAERGVRELRDVMDGKRTYDEKGHVS